MTTQTRQRRRPRAILAWGVMLFLLIQVGSGALLDYVWPSVRFTQLDHVLQAVPRDQLDNVIVCLGSSRFQCGIDPQEVSRLLEKGSLSKRPAGVLNAAVPSADPLLCEFLLRQLLETGVKPGCLVLEVSPETLSRHTEWLMYHARTYLTLDQLPAFAGELVQQGHALRILSLRLFPLYYYRHSVLSKLYVAPTEGTVWEARQPRYCRLAQQPFQSSYASADQVSELLKLPERPVSSLMRQEIERTLIHQLPLRWLDHYQAQGSNTAALERILKLCSQRGIPVVLVGVPVTAAQRQRYVGDVHHKYSQYLARVCCENGCDFVDANDWLPDGFFMDNHHLNEEGKTYFSRLLAIRVIAPSWPKQEAMAARADHRSQP